MIKLLKPVPRTLTLAVSGGVDSMAMLDFFQRRHDVTVAFFNHGTENSERAFEFLANYCTQQDLPMIIGHVTGTKPKDQSWEEYWRNQRYQFLDRLGVVATAHNLDDCVETWIWSSLHGTPKLIPYTRNQIIRPFLTTPKSELIDWCQRKQVPWIEDTSNQDLKYTRNYVRHELMPHALKINPGLHKVIAKKIIDNS